MKSRSKKIFLALSVIIPLLAYSGYYYGMMIKNAAYNFDEFESLTFRYGYGPNPANVYTSSNSTYRYINRRDSMVVRKVVLSREDLHEIHRKAFKLGFWNFPEVIGDSASAMPHYYLELKYKRKSKSVLYDDSFNGDERLRLATKTLIDLVNKTLNDAEKR